MRIDYNNVRAEAKKLQNVAAECDAGAQVCTRYQNELPVYWEGDAAQAYIRGLQQLSRKNQALAENIRQLSRQITLVANELEESDRRLAAQIARRNAAAAAAAAQPKPPAPPVKRPSVAASVKKAVPKINTNTMEKAANAFLDLMRGKR